MRHLRSAIAVALLGLVGCGVVHDPDRHGPEWIGNAASALTDKMGNPDRRVALPLPSLTTVYVYGAGAAPGFALCERDYFVRGATVIGYSEHGSAPGCTRSAGRTD